MPSRHNRLRVRLCLAAAALAMVAVQPGSAQNQKAGPLRAGAAKVDFTPGLNDVAPGVPKSPMLPVLSIRDHLMARAIFFDNGTSCGALVGVEQGNSRDLDKAAAQAAKDTGCPVANIVISATHTHSSGLKAAAGDTPPDNLPTAAQVGAAVVKAINLAKTKLQPARIGYGTTRLYNNVNKELFIHNRWSQGPDLEGPSDKTLAVIGFIGADGLPIGFYMNYAMHPIDFYITGVLSGDFPGDASRFLEKRYDDKAVAIFTQGASGDQNPLYLERLGAARVADINPDAELFGLDPNAVRPPRLNANADHVKAMQLPLPASAQPAYDKAKAATDELVHAYGVLTAEAALAALKSPEVAWSDNPRIGGSVDNISCPGRDRLDTSAREGVLPPYKDGDPVAIQVGALRLGDIDLVTVNGEVYNDIATHLKRVSPSGKTMMVTLSAGPNTRSGYIYSNRAGDHLTFEVIGSRLKPGCAEDAIVASGVKQITTLNK